MDSDRLMSAAVVGAKRAGFHALRAASEVIAGVAAFADELRNALQDVDDDGVEHIDVEPDDDD